MWFLGLLSWLRNYTSFGLYSDWFFCGLQSSLDKHLHGNHCGTLHLSHFLQMFRNGLVHSMKQPRICYKKTLWNAEGGYINEFNTEHSLKMSKEEKKIREQKYHRSLNDTEHVHPTHIQIRKVYSKKLVFYPLLHFLF